MGKAGEVWLQLATHQGTKSVSTGHNSWIFLSFYFYEFISCIHRNSKLHVEDVTAF